MKSNTKIRSVLFAVVSICAIVLLGSITAKAETAIGTIKGNNVNVRSGAGTANVKVTSLSNGEAVIVTGSATDPAGKKWYAVKFTKNSREYTGYIIESYVTCKAIESPSEQDNSQTTEQQAESQQSASSSASEWTGTVQGTSVNVRKKAVTGTVLGSVSTGTKVTVRKSKTGSDGKEWYYISVKINGSTKKGWIRSDFVKKTETQPEQTTQTEEPVQTETVSELKGVVQGTNVNVRKKAVTGTVIGSVSTGAEVTVKKNETGSDGKVWYYISAQITGSLKEGWIRSDFVKITQTEQADSKENESGTANTENEDSAGTKEEPVQEIKKGNLKGNYVRARQKPVNGTMICYLMAGAELVIEGEEKGSDGYTWYKVAFQYNGVAKSGYVRSDFVELQVQQSTGEDAQEEVLSDEDFEAYLNAQGFPKSYKNSLRNLHNIHPEWEFRAVKTGLDWNDAITAESKVGTNLVTKAAIASWKSTEKTAYNWKTNSWYTFDGGAWVAASKDIVSYYMDPRNFLTETTVFQFESLEYEPYQNKQGVKRLLKGSFMSGSYKEPDGKKRSYANTFVKAGKAVGVSPYHLAARCYQEQGTGKSGSISGTVSGYENTFNYYNIGAYAQGGNSPVVQGLIYASSSTSKNTNYDRPWNTRYKSIMGGAQYVAQKYVKVGQNTLYFQKFNVVNKKNGLYRHQYMTNIQAAEAEAVKMSKAYTAEDKQLAFYIPVYENMPDAPSAKPVSNANPNNYLASLEIADQQLTPVFDPEVTEYDLTVPKKVKKVKIQATAVAGTSTVTGTGKVKLARGENVFTVICKAENGVEKTYTIHIVRE